MADLIISDEIIRQESITDVVVSYDSATFRFANSKQSGAIFFNLIINYKKNGQNTTSRRQIVADNSRYVDVRNGQIAEPPVPIINNPPQQEQHPDRMFFVGEYDFYINYIQTSVFNYETLFQAIVERHFNEGTLIL